jgi:hypothetical protein
MNIFSVFVEGNIYLIKGCVLISGVCFEFFELNKLSRTHDVYGCLPMLSISMYPCILINLPQTLDQGSLILCGKDEQNKLYLNLICTLLSSVSKF